VGPALATSSYLEAAQLPGSSSLGLSRGLHPWSHNTFGAVLTQRIVADPLGDKGPEAYFSKTTRGD